MNKQHTGSYQMFNPGQIPTNRNNIWDY